MNFKYTDDQIEIRRMVRDWAQGSLAPRAAEVDETQEFPWDNVKGLMEQDRMGIAYDEELGGGGADAISEAIAMEEVTAACAATGSIMTGHYLGFDAIYLAGTDEQKERWLRPALEGEKLAAFCLTEPAGGSDPTATRTTAVEDGDDYVINGVKHFITSGAEADFLTVFAMTDRSKGRDGLTCFVVEKGTPGMTPGASDDKMGIRGALTWEMVFEDCRVPKENIIGEIGKGYRLALDVIDRGRIGIAAMCIGVSQRAFDLAVKYAKEREVFGRPISKFQGIAWMIADMGTQLEAARMLTYYAADLKDRGENFSKVASMAKVFGAESAHKIVTTALQIHGGYGYMKEYEIERLYRDQRILELFEGTSQIQRIVISGQILREN